MDCVNAKTMQSAPEGRYIIEPGGSNVESVLLMISESWKKAHRRVMVGDVQDISRAVEEVKVSSDVM